MYASEQMQQLPVPCNCALLHGSCYLAVHFLHVFTTPGSCAPCVLPGED